MMVFVVAICLCSMSWAVDEAGVTSDVDALGDWLAQTSLTEEDVDGAASSVEEAGRAARPPSTKFITVKGREVLEVGSNVLFHIEKSQNDNIVLYTVGRHTVHEAESETGEVATRVAAYWMDVQPGKTERRRVELNALDNMAYPPVHVASLCRGSSCGFHIKSVSEKILRVEGSEDEGWHAIATHADGSEYRVEKVALDIAGMDITSTITGKLLESGEGVEEIVTGNMMASLTSMMGGGSGAGDGCKQQ